MTTRKLRRAGLMAMTSLSLALSLQPLVTTPASAQWIVYDPSNFSQNVMTAARELQQINNQIQMLTTQGAKLIGQYDSSVAFGQSRILLVWTRIIMPDGNSIVLERQPGADTGISSGPKVSGRLAPILTPVQPLSLCEAVTIATQGTSRSNCAK
ncbi:hypothetical protein ACVILL_004327 [Bradyrhizobium sp. USDA 3364]